MVPVLPGNPKRFWAPFLQEGGTADEHRWTRIGRNRRQDEAKGAFQAHPRLSASICGSSPSRHREKIRQRNVKKVRIPNLGIPSSYLSVLRLPFSAASAPPRDKLQFERVSQTAASKSAPRNQVLCLLVTGNAGQATKRMKYLIPRTDPHEPKD